MNEVEERLVGGNASAGVVRIRSTVRKPSTVGTASVHSFLSYLHLTGFDAAPRSLGFDEQNRHVLEYIPGTLASCSPELTEAELNRVGEIIRRFHDLSSQYCPPQSARWNVVMTSDGDDLVCHNDLAPWNLVRDGKRWAFIDWDGAAPGTRLWDLGYAAVTFLPITPSSNLPNTGQRLRAFLDGYQLSSAQRKALPSLMLRRTRAMYELLAEGAERGRQPWARLYASGHGDYWGSTASYIERHLGALERLVA